MSEELRRDSDRTIAEVRHTRWPGLIWAVPIAAAGVLVWFGARAIAGHGEHVTVTFDKGYGLKKSDSKVTLRGVEVGEVSDITLADDARHVDVRLKLQPGVDKFLRSGTRFWLVGAKPSLSNSQSLRGLITGPEIGMQPGPGQRADHFQGLDQPPASNPGVPLLTYLVRLQGPAGAVTEGAPVTLDGFRIGTVRQTRLVYDLRSGSLQTPAEIVIDPSKVGLQGAPPPIGGNYRPVINAMLRRLIFKGYRARLTKDPPFIGSSQISLEMVPGAPAATLGWTGNLPVIPGAAPGDIDAITAEASDVLGKIDALPIDAIGTHLRSTAAHIDAIASSPQLRASIVHLNTTIATLNRTVQQAAPQVTPLVVDLRRAADAADRTAQAASTIVAGDPARQDSDLPSALHELTAAARSIRTLADYLERHPETLIKGKPGGRK